MKDSHKALGSVAVAALLVALGVATSVWMFSATKETAAARSHTLVVMNSVQAFQSALRDAETSQRGYLLTGDEAFRASYVKVRDGLDRDLAALRQLTLLPAADGHLDAMAPMVQAKLAEMEQVLALRGQGNATGALALVRDGQGKRLMDAIAAEVSSIVALEEDALAQRDAAFQSNLRGLLILIVLAGLSAIGAAFAFAYASYRASKQQLKDLVYRETERLLELQKDTNRQLQLANSTLQASEEKLAVTLQSIGDALITTDAAGRITLLNPVAEKLTGWTRTLALGHQVDEVFHIIHQATRQRLAAPVAAVLAQGRVQSLPQHTLLLSLDGTECDIADSCAPIRDHEARVVGAVLVFRDVTERRRLDRLLEEKNLELERTTLMAERASRVKSEFLAAMSHEIRTPMNGVIGMLEVLQQSSLNVAQLDIANVIHESAFALLAVINDILDFSKIEAGKLEIDAIPMSVADVVNSSCQNMNRMASKNEVELTLFTDPAIPSAVLGDPGRLRQALVNLTSNAIKFSSGLARPARVCVRALLIASNAEQVTLEIHVIDNGIGIDAPTRERLFTAFTQADVSTTRNFGGTGLGLAITRQLIELMGGQISVTSEPGQGSLFRVQLAFARPIEQPQATPADGVVADRPCLVLADEPGLAEDLACYLAHDKFQVELVQSLPAAQHWIAHQPAGQCVVVIDGRDAKSTLQSLRAVANDQAGVELRFVVIGRGRRRRPRLELPDLVSVDANVLTHETLQDSVAIALGRAKALDGRDLIVADSVAPASLSREATRRQGRLILVAEDNPMNQKVILQQLSLLGRTADIASTGVEAFQRWQSGDYDLLFADLHMPQMDGYELTAAVRAAEAGKTRIPIIAFTANALKGEADHCLAVGMDDYLSKPVQLANLKAMLEKWQSVISSEPLVSPAHSARATAYGAADLATPAVDVRVLRSLIGGDAMLSREFLHDFRLTAANIAVELRDCCNAGNALAAGSAAHKLKSSCASVGALALRELCVALEVAGKRGDMPGLSRLLPGFEHELARVNDFVQLY